MKAKLCSLLVVVGFYAGWAVGKPAGAQDVVAAVKKGTADLAAADQVVVGARNNLAAARRNLDTNEFNSASYNARVTAGQAQTLKEKFEKAAAKDKEDAQELYELAQELAEQRKVEFEAAQKVLPQREAEAKAAEDKYAAALVEAEKLAAQIKALVRQSEADAATKQKDSKLAIEKAAFSKATAEQRAAVAAQARKTMADLVSADAAVQKAAAALKQATDKDRAPKLAEMEKATKAYAVALNAAAEHLATVKKPETQPALAKATAGLAAAERALERANGALGQAKNDVQYRTNVIKDTENRIKAGQEAVAKRIAKIRAKKDLEREQAALQRAIAAKQESEKVLPTVAANAEKAQKEYQAALAALVKALVPTPDVEKSLQADRAAITKAMADKEVELKNEATTLANEAAAAQKAAEAAQAALAASERSLAERIGVREALDRTLQRRFYREAGTAQNEQRQAEAAVAAAERELQPKVAALNAATTAANQAKDAAAKAQKAAADQAALVAKATQERDAAAKSAQQNAANQPALQKAQAALQAAEKQRNDAATAAKAAADKAAAAQAALDKATAEKNAAEQLIGQRRQAVEAKIAQVAGAKAAAYGGLKPLAANAWDYAKARHLLLRAGFGGTPDEIAQLHAMGLHRAVSHLVDYKRLPAPDIALATSPRERPENYEGALIGEEQRRLAERRVALDRQQIHNMRTWWLRRMIESPRPLEEKLTLFWHGQIPSQYSDVGDSYYMYLQNELFRDHAAGNFSSLLYGIAHDAAMLKYLNNDTNVKGRANENLAREIIELFSMGRDQGYSEIDIRQGARALTGFTYEPWTGQFRFISERHDTEPKTIFGKSGNWSGDDYVKLILETPYPPKFIARQMFIFFVHDEPSIDSIEALATVLKLNNFELSAMLENLFLSEEFYSPRAMATQVKGPVQLVVALHRELGLKNADLGYLAEATREMGQELFDPPSVFGWQSGRTWITTSRTFSRYNALAEIVERRPRAGKTGVDVVGTVLAGKTFQSHADVVDYLIKCCLNVPLSPAKRQALIDFLKPLPAPSAWAANPAPANALLTRLLVMLVCSPEYQLG